VIGFAEPATFLRPSRAILRLALPTLLPTIGQRGPINESVFLRNHTCAYTGLVV